MSMNKADVLIGFVAGVVTTVGLYVLYSKANAFVDSVVESLNVANEETETPDIAEADMSPEEIIDYINEHTTAEAVGLMQDEVVQQLIAALVYIVYSTTDMSIPVNRKRYELLNGVTNPEVKKALSHQMRKIIYQLYSADITEIDEQAILSFMRGYSYGQ